MDYDRRIMIVVGALLLSLTLPVMSLGAKSRRILAGEWGAQGVRMIVEGNSARLEFDCAHATITGPLKLDSRGRFKLAGTFVLERGGPVRSDNSENNEPAEFSGWTDGRKLTLAVKLKGSKETLGTYSLVRGQSARLFKCL